MTSIPNADARLRSLARWLSGLPGPAVLRVAPASADASFRRYYRVHRTNGTQIAMDAPPEQEDLAPYLRVAQLLAQTGVSVPRVLAVDRARGFVLLDDLGDRRYLDALAAGADPEPLYADAIDALLRIQSAGSAQAGELPLYDRELLWREMNLFPEWFLDRHLRLDTGAGERHVIAAAFEWLCERALAQPIVLVHRDYHSRNLMICPGRNPGILDFQDAVRGPISYDLVSLLKDCYIVWPRARQLAWIDRYHAGAAKLGLPVGASRDEFLGWYDSMGLQRHIKVLGIFARLWHRDRKQGYLADLPRVLDYTLDATGREPALAAFDDFLRRRVAPALAAGADRAGAR